MKSRLKNDSNTQNDKKYNKTIKNVSFIAIDQQNTDVANLLVPYLQYTHCTDGL